MGILGGILSSVAGSLAGGLVSKSGSDKSTTTETEGTTSAIPTWSTEQYPYVWGEGYEFPTYQLSDAAKDYGNQLTQGYRGYGGTQSAAPMNSAQMVAASQGGGGQGMRNNYQSLLGFNQSPRLTYDQLFAPQEEEKVEEQATGDNSAVTNALLQDYVNRKMSALGEQNAGQWGGTMLGTDVPRGNAMAGIQNSYVGGANGVSPYAVYQDDDLMSLYNSGALGTGYGWMGS